MPNVYNWFVTSIYLPNMITLLSRSHYFICTLRKAEMYSMSWWKVMLGHYGASSFQSVIYVSEWRWSPLLQCSLHGCEAKQSKQVLIDSPFCKSRQDTSSLLSFKMRHAVRHAFNNKTSQDVLCISQREEAKKDTETRHCHNESWKRVKYCGSRRCF